MLVQEGGPYEVAESLPKDAQCEMMLRQREFQRSLGFWDDRISDKIPTFCLPGRALYHLDSAVQECSEAWDMLAGGWKHHRRNPEPAPRHELVLELVDVAAFLYNAYLFMGGQPEAEIIARRIDQRVVRISLPKMDLETAWGLAAKPGGDSEAMALFSHATGAHGQPWEGVVAARVNYLRHKVFTVAAAIRYGLSSSSREDRTPERFPANAGWLYVETILPLYSAIAAVPECTAIEFYSAHRHKADVNEARQRGGY